MTTTTLEVELIARLRDDDTDPVMLRQAADLITALIEERAGQSHADAGLLAALERSTEGWANALELGLIPERHRNTAEILAEDGRAALAAAKGA